MVKSIGMDYKSIDYGGNKIKRKRQSFLSVKINNLYWSKSNTFIVIIGTKFAIFSMEGHFNTFTTGFNITPTKISKKEDGLLFKILN